MNLKGFRKEQDRIRQFEEEKEKTAKAEHKCNNCPWGTFIDNKKVVCSFSRCIKEKF